MKEQEINRYWKRIINTMNDGLTLIGPNGTILMVNHAFEQMTGYIADEVLGLPCTMLHCDACESTLKEDSDVWCTLFEQGRDDMKRCHCHIMKKDGGYIPVLKNASVLKDDQGMQIGAVETFTDISEISRLDQEVNKLARQLDADGDFQGMIGKSDAMHKVFDVIRKAALSEASVIIYGESGSGKELVALALHRLGRRKEGPFVQLNCAALNEALLESELFGHVKGAFTGAYRHRPGRFAAAHGGDFFLDEIGDMPLSIQVKLLRVLETGQFEHVGDHRPVSADVRIIAATNRNLEELIARKQFREDFFFRINVIPIRLPPLRQRTEDIPLLVDTFIRHLQTRTGKAITGLTRTAMERFMTYHWPGNIRELKSALEYAFVIAEKGLIGCEQLPPRLADRSSKPKVPSYIISDAGGSLSRPCRVDSDEKEALIKALGQTNGNQSQAARLLGVCRVTVWNRMRKYGINLKKGLASENAS
ncbi:sigma 54-interacting transcriptional regulator [Desulfococcaceae bacterium HSG9]|nr:sigma 54-interacting transcriptional regulator [Desulfococcaceae bacterium HSG9]